MAENALAVLVAGRAPVTVRSICGKYYGPHFHTFTFAVQGERLFSSQEAFGQRLQARCRLQHQAINTMYGDNKRHDLPQAGEVRGAGAAAAGGS